MAVEHQHIGDVPATHLDRRTTGENIQDLTQAAKQLFEAGQQLAKNLNELQRRLEHATDLKAQLKQRPWLIALVALAAGIAGWRFFSTRHNS